MGKKSIITNSSTATNRFVGPGLPLSLCPSLEKLDPPSHPPLTHSAHFCLPCEAKYTHLSLLSVALASIVPRCGGPLIQMYPCQPVPNSPFKILNGSHHWKPNRKYLHYAASDVDTKRRTQPPVNRRGEKTKDWSLKLPQLQIRKKGISFNTSNQWEGNVGVWDE